MPSHHSPQMSESQEPRYSSEQLFEDHNVEPSNVVHRKSSPARSRLCLRFGKIMPASFLALAVFALFQGWRIFMKPELEKLSSKSSHRSACSTYPEDCQKIAPFVFDSVYSLLKQWPSSYAPNGHSVVPGRVAPNTLLYHAKKSPGKPKSPTFFAFDAEMSLAIYGSSGTPELHTMTTTKELRVIYLDGHSATLTSTGTLDSQMAILEGHVSKDPSEDLVYNENQRAVELCQLADKLGIDGVVRMNAGFEILVCDYSKSNVRNFFTANVTVPGNEAREHDASLPRDPHRQPPLGYGNDFSEQNGWEWFRSSTWHYGNGNAGGIPENRIRLDLCGFASWYDPSLRSLIYSHHGGLDVNGTYQNGWGLRRGHRLLGASKEDIGTFREWIFEATTRHENSKCSNTDWQALIDTITSKYDSRAQEILFHLNKNSSDDQAAHIIVESVYTLSHAILFPYLEYPIVAGVTKSEAKAKTVARCSEAYTGHIDLESLSDFEMLIEQSAHIINSRLCQWAWDIFEWSDSRMYGRLQQRGRTTAPNSFGNMRVLRDEIVQRNDETRTLLKWIGWETWQKCKTKCAPNELCYIPMWPVIYAPGQPQGGIYAGVDLTDEETVEFWKPKCISRQDFDCGGGRGREPQHQFPDVPYEKCKALQNETKT